MAKTRSKDTNKAADKDEDDKKVATESKKIKKQPKEEKKKATKADAGKKGGKTKKSDDDDQKDNKAKTTKNNKKDEESEEEEEEKQDKKGVKKGAKKGAAKDTKDKAAKGNASVKGYTPDQYEKYKELKKELSAYTNQQLKDMLVKNEQASTGNKDDLITKCADGKVLGKIPRCPKCFGGRPRFDFKTGIYTCPGYRDDTDFKNCRKKYTLEELPREEWQD